MKRLILGALLALLCVPLTAEVRYQAVSATATAQTIPINATAMTIINDGANEVYVRVFDAMQTPAAATTASWEIKSGEGFDIGRTAGIGAVSIVCDTAETATVRLVIP